MLVGTPQIAKLLNRYCKIDNLINIFQTDTNNGFSRLCLLPYNWYSHKKNFFLKINIVILKIVIDIVIL